MRIFAWLVANVWSQWHILRFGLPLCGTPVPDKVQAWTDRAVRPSDWPRVCLKCRELALAQNEKPADSGEAVSGPNGRVATTGAIRPEDTALVENGQTP